MLRLKLSDLPWNEPGAVNGHRRKLQSRPAIFTPVSFDSSNGALHHSQVDETWYIFDLTALIAVCPAPYFNVHSASKPESQIVLNFATSDVRVIVGELTEFAGGST